MHYHSMPLLRYPQAFRSLDDWARAVAGPGLQGDRHHGHQGLKAGRVGREYNVCGNHVGAHSAHHEKAHLPYWELTPYSDAPKMPYGYLSTFFFALLFPWLYRKRMAQKLKDWDENYASDAEKQIAASIIN